MLNGFEKYYNNSLRFLSFRPRSKKEVEDFLKKKKVDVSLILQIITKLESQKFIDDNEFARLWIESRIRFKPRSIKLIKRELLQKGIDQEIIETQMNNLNSPIDGQVTNDIELAKKVIEKKITRYKNLSKIELYEKLGRILAQKGFDWDTIKSVLNSQI